MDTLVNTYSTDPGFDATERDRTLVDHRMIIQKEECYGSTRFRIIKQCKCEIDHGWTRVEQELGTGGFSRWIYLKEAEWWVRP